MDQLAIILLIAIGIAVSAGKTKKKNAAAQARMKEAFEEASSAETAEAAVQPADHAKRQVKIPYTKEEWAQFLQETDPSAAGEAARKRTEKAMPRSGDSSPISRMQPARPADASSGEGREAEKLRAQRLRPDAQHREGETRAEHAAHIRRIAEEEQRAREQQASLRELQSMNLKKLRTAVVMSEVLDRPLALRRRR